MPISARMFVCTVRQLLKITTVNAVLPGKRLGCRGSVHLQLRIGSAWKVHEETAGSSQLKVPLGRSEELEMQSEK